jgi:hypothetical protein
MEVEGDHVVARERDGHRARRVRDIHFDSTSFRNSQYEVDSEDSRHVLPPFRPNSSFFDLSPRFNDYIPSYRRSFMQVSIPPPARPYPPLAYHPRNTAE